MDRLVNLSGKDLLAARQLSELTSDAMAEWDELNSRAARELPGLAALFHRPSPLRGVTYRAPASATPGCFEVCWPNWRVGPGMPPWGSQVPRCRWTW